MTYQTIYSSESTLPMQTDDLEALLVEARSRNTRQGISGALIYTDGIFLQVVEGEREKVDSLMANIKRDNRHRNVTILREGEVAAAEFKDWGMAYVSATPEEAAEWAGIRNEAANADDQIDIEANLLRTARFAHDILALRSHGEAGEPSSHAVAQTA